MIFVKISGWCQRNLNPKITSVYILFTSFGFRCWCRTSEKHISIYQLIANQYISSSIRYKKVIENSKQLFQHERHFSHTLSVVEFINHYEFDNTSVKNIYPLTQYICHFFLWNLLDYYIYFLLICIYFSRFNCHPQLTQSQRGKINTWLIISGNLNLNHCLNICIMQIVLETMPMVSFAFTCPKIEKKFILLQINQYNFYKSIDFSGRYM